MEACPLCQLPVEDARKHMRQRRSYGGHGLGTIEIERHIKQAPKPPAAPTPAPAAADDPDAPVTGYPWGFFLTHP